MRLIALPSTIAVAVFLAWVGIAAQSPATPPEIASVLTDVAHFTSEDMASLEAGQVITRTETFPDLLEASVVAAVRINSQKDRTLAYFKTLISYVDGQVTTGYGTFSRPPAEADVKSLTLDRGDIADLESCVPGDCAIRVRAAAPASPAVVDWTAADATSRANAWMRQQLTAYTADYMQRGNAALVAFDDQATPVNLIGHWQALADRSTIVARLAPSLLRYATSYPVTTEPGVTDELYWDHQHYLGLKPIIGVTQLVSYTDPSRPQRSVLLQKQIYASHYLYGSLALTLLLQTSTAQAPVTYVVYVNRARGDLLRAGQAQQPASTSTTNRGGLTGALNGIRAGLNNLGGTLQRRLGEQMIRSSAERLLSSMKEALER